MSIFKGSSLRQSVTLTGARLVSVHELARMCQLNLREMRELLDYGLLNPMPGFADPPMFSEEIAHHLMRANQIRMDFDLDLFTVVIIMDYQLQIDALQAKIQLLKMALSERSRVLPF